MSTAREKPSNDGYVNLANMSTNKNDRSSAKQLHLSKKVINSDKMETPRRKFKYVMLLGALNEPRKSLKDGTKSTSTADSRYVVTKKIPIGLASAVSRNSNLHQNSNKDLKQVSVASTRNNMSTKVMLTSANENNTNIVTVPNKLSGNIPNKLKGNVNSRQRITVTARKNTLKDHTAVCSQKRKIVKGNSNNVGCQTKKSKVIRDEEKTQTSVFEVFSNNVIKEVLLDRDSDQTRKRPLSSSETHPFVSKKRMLENLSTYCLVKPVATWEDPITMQSKFKDICKICYSEHHDGSTQEECPLQYTSSSKVITNCPESSLGYDLPQSVLLGHSRAYENKLSLFARDKMPKQTHFGPLKGNLISAEKLRDISLNKIDLEHFWPLRTKSTCGLEVEEYIDTSDKAESNWLRFLLPEHESAFYEPNSSHFKANVQRVLRDGEIYFVTIRDVSEGDELFMRAMEPPEAIFFNVAAMLNDVVMRPKAQTKIDGCDLCTVQWLPEGMRKLGASLNLIETVRHRRMNHPSLRGLCELAQIFTCFFCGECFFNRHRLSTHFGAAHKDDMAENIYRCQLCKMLFQTLGQLVAHTHKNHVYTEIVCPLCSLKSKSLEEHQAHVMTEHPKPKKERKSGENIDSFKCLKCDIEYKSRLELRRHRKKTHAQPVVCEICGHSVGDWYKLKIHMFSHTDVKPFDCQIPMCSAKYCQSDKLRNHYRKVHGMTKEDIPPIKMNELPLPGYENNKTLNEKHSKKLFRTVNSETETCGDTQKVQNKDLSQSESSHDVSQSNETLQAVQNLQPIGIDDGAETDDAPEFISLECSEPPGKKPKLSQSNEPLQTIDFVYI